MVVYAVSLTGQHTYTEARCVGLCVLQDATDPRIVTCWTWQIQQRLKKAN